MRSLARFFALDAWERRVLVRAWFLLPLTAARVRWLGLARAQATSRSGPRLQGAEAMALAQRIARWVHLASRHGPFRPTCLPLSLVLQRLLREQGIESDLRFGVRKAAGFLEGHAWVERDGVALADPPAEGPPFAAFDEPIRALPRAPR